jgi:hypothetical protein
MPKLPYKKTLPMSTVKPDPEGAGLLDAHQMQIYDEIIMTAMKGSDLSEAIQRLRAVPVEQRYISRIIAALGFVFGDFDGACVRLDLDTLPSDELDRITTLLHIMSAQFCMLVAAVFGPDLMRTIMSDAMESTRASVGDSGA